MLRTTLVAKEETHCLHSMGYSFQLAARDLLYTLSHIQDSTYHSICKEPLILKEETHCHHSIGYSFQLAARAILYAPFHRQDSTYHSICKEPLILKEETHCHHSMGYSFWLPARVLLYAPSYTQDSTFHKMTGMRKSSVGSLGGIDPIITPIKTLAFSQNQQNAIDILLQTSSKIWI